ncbi:MAG TPA: cytidine deaminase [Armatimonadetes bacterium]|jgi:dCMP deaminase|nr:cytidine deaminase [Armatimonadota bacterium]
MAETDGPAADERPAWDDYFMEITHVVAKRSTCLRRHVGAVLVRDRRILTTGYNGPPKGLEHCGELGGCYREQLGVPSGQRQEICRAVHAEQNAIVQAAVHGVKLDEATLYLTTQPCVTCAKMLINANVTRIVYEGPYPDELAVRMLTEAGVELVRYRPAGEEEDSR